MRTINFDREKRDALRKAWRAAVDQDKDEFMFEGHLFLTDYAKYVLEYLDSKLGK